MDAAVAPDLFLAHTEDQALLRESCREVLEREMPMEWVRQSLESASGWDRTRWKVMTELGWTGVSIPEPYGGAGLGLVELGVLAEEFGRALIPGPFLASSAVGITLSRWGSDEQRSHWLPRLVDGSCVATWSVDVDRHAGEVTAERAQGDSGGVVLRGTRHFVPAAEESDLLLIDVTLDGAPTLALVPRKAAGLSLREMTTVDLTRPYFEVEFAGVAIDAGSLVLGEDPQRARQDLVDAGSALQCAESIGAARRLVELTVEHVQQRRQFDRPIGSFQAIKHRLADMRVGTASSLVASRYATWAVAERRHDASRAVHVAKQHGGEACSWVASEALQLHGGVAFTWEHDLHLYLRRLKANELTLGSPDWHSLQLGRWRLENAAD